MFSSILLREKVHNKILVATGQFVQMDISEKFKMGDCTELFCSISNFS